MASDKPRETKHHAAKLARESRNQLRNRARLPGIAQQPIHQWVAVDMGYRVDVQHHPEKQQLGIRPKQGADDGDRSQQRCAKEENGQPQ